MNDHMKLQIKTMLVSIDTFRNGMKIGAMKDDGIIDKNEEKILKKVGEECTEVIIGAMKGSKEETVFEIADLCYHVMVLMVNESITPDDIRKELAGRHVVDHKVKQETMQ